MNFFLYLFTLLIILIGLDTMLDLSGLILILMGG
jgi:hypothetical protein